MSAAPRPGWYPDPAGTPDLYRWWDGGDWTGAISESPQAPSPQMHSPARPEDEVVRRRPSRMRAAVALLVCVALFLSATVGLGLAIFGDGTGTGRGHRSPADAATPEAGVPAAGAALFLRARVGLGLAIFGDGTGTGRGHRSPADAATPDAGVPAAGAAVGRLDPSTRVATLGPASMTLPGPAYTPKPDPMRVRGLLDVCFLASAPVHVGYDGGRSWSAAVVFGRLSPAVTGDDLEKRADQAVRQLGRVLFPSTSTRVETRGVAEHAVDGHEGWLLSVRVHYEVEDLPSRYDDLTALLVRQDDGSVVLAASSVPDDADPQLSILASDALASLTFS